eukprot:g2280.t1
MAEAKIASTLPTPPPNNLRLEVVDSIDLSGVDVDLEFCDHLEEDIDGEGLPSIDLDLKRPRVGSEVVVGTSESLVSVYGRPKNPEECAKLCPPQPGGLVYHSQLVTEGWVHEKHTTQNGTIKPRRAILPVHEKDFFSSLVKTEDNRWIFSGVLNGWPALTCLELISITCIAKRKTWLGRKKIIRFWSKGKGRPTFPVGPKSVRATLRAPYWTAQGWSQGSKGNVWWYESRREIPRFTYGQSIVKNFQLDEKENETFATHVHMFSHRYARPGKNGYETTKQKLTYHGAILLEWNHQKYCTVVELATLNGVGGRKGKSNWYDDKLEESTELYRAMPREMIMPWKGKYAEIRVHDVKAKNVEEFQNFLQKYEGTELRFLDCTFAHHSNEVRLHHRKRSDIASYLLNYIGRDRRYDEQFRNCQTFASDFYGFLAGKKGIVPVKFVNRTMYINRAHNFLYIPEMYGEPHQ